MIQLNILLKWIAGTSGEALGHPGAAAVGIPREGTGLTMAFAASELFQAIRGEEVG